jgi:hypothetical protein
VTSEYFTVYSDIILRKGLSHYLQYSSSLHGALGLNPKSIYVGFVVDKVALERAFSGYFGFQYRFPFHQLLLMRSSDALDSRHSSETLHAGVYAVMGPSSQQRSDSHPASS